MTEELQKKVSCKHARICSTVIAVLVVAVIAMAAFIAYSYIGASGGFGKAMSDDALIERVEDLVIESSNGENTFVFKEIREEYGVVAVSFELGVPGLDPVDQEVLISRDGELIIMQSVTYEEILVQIAEMQAVQAEAAAAAAAAVEVPVEVVEGDDAGVIEIEIVE